MKERNFELSPLTEREFSMMLIGCSDELLSIYLSWLTEELYRRGTTVNRGIIEQLNELSEPVIKKRRHDPPEYTGEW